MDEKIKRYEGQEITINIPFIYTIGEVGYHTGTTLETIEDCKNEVLAEIDADVLNTNEIFFNSRRNQKTIILWKTC